MHSTSRRLTFLLVLPLLGLQKPAPPQAQEQLPVIRSIVEVVNVLCTVKDKKGRIISDLDKKDFTVLEEGKPQEIRFFAREANLPLTIGLLIDSSPSQGNLIPLERDAGITFLDTVLKEKDLAFLISFDSDVDLLQDFTANRGLLRRGLEQVRVGGGGVPGGPFPSQRTGGTHLYDALYLAATDKLSREVGRKTVILLTDGEDQGSRLKVHEAIEATQKADVVVYGVLLVDRAFYGGRFGMGFGYGGEGVLKKMSEETGGRMIRADRPQDLRRAFDEIAEELRSQYSIGYSSSDPRRDGGFRKLEIKLANRDLRVQARKGYYAVPSGGGN